MPEEADDTDDNMEEAENCKKGQMGKPEAEGGYVQGKTDAGNTR